jgi:hypothetical protein
MMLIIMRTQVDVSMDPDITIRKATNIAGIVLFGPFLCCR